MSRSVPESRVPFTILGLVRLKFPHVLILSLLLRQPRPPSPVPTGSLQAGSGRQVISKLFLCLSLGTLNWLPFSLSTPTHPQTAPNFLHKNESLAEP